MKRRSRMRGRERGRGPHRETCAVALVVVPRWLRLSQRYTLLTPQAVSSVDDAPFARRALRRSLGRIGYGQRPRFSMRATTTPTTTSTVGRAGTEASGEAKARWKGELDRRQRGRQRPPAW